MSYDDIQDQIDEGRQQAAEELGPPHDVYRMVNQGTDGSVLIAGNKIATGVSIFTKIAYGAEIRSSFEAERQQGVLWYSIIADMSPFKVGDIFIVNDPVYGRGYSSVNFVTTEFKGFALADHSPVKKALGGRLNTTVNVLRPSKGPNDKAQFDKTVNNATPLVLTAGAFDFGDVGDVAAKIPAGLVSTGKSYGDRSFQQVPAEQRKSGWQLYMPALSGFKVREGDRIVAADGAAYIVVVPYVQAVGASGAQWFLERERAGG